MDPYGRGGMEGFFPMDRRGSGSAPEQQNPYGTQTPRGPSPYAPYVPPPPAAPQTQMGGPGAEPDPTQDRPMPPRPGQERHDTGLAPPPAPTADPRIAGSSYLGGGFVPFANFLNAQQGSRSPEAARQPQAVAPGMHTQGEQMYDHGYQAGVTLDQPGGQQKNFDQYLYGGN